MFGTRPPQSPNHPLFFQPAPGFRHNHHNINHNHNHDQPHPHDPANPNPNPNPNPPTESSSSSAATAFDLAQPPLELDLALALDPNLDLGLGLDLGLDLDLDAAAALDLLYSAPSAYYPPVPYGADFDPVLPVTLGFAAMSSPPAFGEPSQPPPQPPRPACDADPRDPHDDEPACQARDAAVSSQEEGDRDLQDLQEQLALYDGMAEEELPDPYGLPDEPEVRRPPYRRSRTPSPARSPIHVDPGYFADRDPSPPAPACDESQVPFVGQVESSVAIAEEYARADPIYIEKTKALSRTFPQYRKVKGDGNCGWRAIAFSYFETLVRAADKSQIEVEVSRLGSFNQMIIGSGGFDPMLFTDMADETIMLLKQLATAACPAAAMETLESTFNTPDVSNAVVYHLRLLASSYLKRNADQYGPFVAAENSGQSVPGYCSRTIEPVNREIDGVGIMLLFEALLKPTGIVLEIAYLDLSPAAEVQVYRYPDEAAGQDPSALGPLVSLMFRPGHYDILYRSATAGRGRPPPGDELRGQMDVAGEGRTQQAVAHPGQVRQAMPFSDRDHDQPTISDGVRGQMGVSGEAHGQPAMPPPDQVDGQMGVSGEAHGQPAVPPSEAHRRPAVPHPDGAQSHLNVHRLMDFSNPQHFSNQDSLRDFSNFDYDVLMMIPGFGSQPGPQHLRRPDGENPREDRDRQGEGAAPACGEPQQQQQQQQQQHHHYLHQQQPWAPRTLNQSLAVRILSPDAGPPPSISADTGARIRFGKETYEINSSPFETRNEPMATYVFKHSHHNPAHFSNPRFQPEEWSPTGQDRADKPGFRKKGKQRTGQ